MRFQPGDTALRRDTFRNGRINHVLSGRVISDDDRGLLVWVGTDSAMLRRTDLSGEPVRYQSRRKLGVTTILSATGWQGGGVLILTPPDTAHSVWWFFSADGEFLGWYVNLETPGHRWSGGHDFMDQALDVWVEPDRSWRWKDEDEFADVTGLPDFWTAETAAAVRSEGEAMIARAEAGMFPFDGTWCDFRPEPDWSPSELPHYWDRVPEHIVPDGPTTAGLPATPFG